MYFKRDHQPFLLETSISKFFWLFMAHKMQKALISTYDSDIF